MPSIPEVEASHQLFTIGQKSQGGQAVCSQLELVTQPSHEVKSPEHPVWQNMTFHIPSHPTLSLSLSIYIYIYPYTHDSKRASRENFERETLEKTRLTHQQSLPKRLFKFLYSFPLHCQILKRLITKTYSHHIHFCESAVRKEPISHWLMLWSSNGIREARKEIGSAQPRWSKRFGGLR